MARKPAPDLKLLALDVEDLAVISAHLQDAVVGVGDFAYLPREQRFAFVCNRFDWQNGERGPQVRRRAGVHFERVRAVKRTGFTPGEEGRVLSLLAITFAATAEPSGHVDLLFSGGAAIRLDVECIEGCLKDLGPAWEARARPCHDDGEPHRTGP